MSKRKPIGGCLLRKRRLRKKKFKAVVKELLGPNNPIHAWLAFAKRLVP